jgi:hypothetical protein
MLRFGILSSVIPLVLVGGLVHDWTEPSARQCLAEGTAAIFDRPVAFTSDPTLATVRVQLVDGPELADLAIADDVEVPGTESCGIREVAQLVRVSTRPVPGEPVIYVSRETGADYRIYVDSAKISVTQAAALLVRARGGHMRLAAAPQADSEPAGALGR